MVMELAGVMALNVSLNYLQSHCYNWKVICHQSWNTVSSYTNVHWANILGFVGNIY